MARHRITQIEIAEHLGIQSPQLNLYLNGRRKPPRGFEASIMRVIEVLAKANKAAERERARVIRSELRIPKQPRRKMQQLTF